MKKYALSVVAISLVFLLSGCHNTAVLNFENEPYPWGIEKDDAAKIISTAGMRRGWRIRQVSPDVLQATLYARSHKAVVAIPLDDDSYSILYHDSQNLDYHDGTIHKNYNKWVRTLERDIYNALEKHTVIWVNRLNPDSTHLDYLADKDYCERMLNEQRAQMKPVASGPSSSRTDFTAYDNHGNAVRGTARTTYNDGSGYYNLGRALALRNYMTKCMDERGWYVERVKKP